MNSGIQVLQVTCFAKTLSKPEIDKATKTQTITPQPHKPLSNKLLDVSVLHVFAFTLRVGG